MRQSKEFDYLVIGAGSGGLTVAVGLQKMNRDVAVVSRNIGGDCTHYGCIPSKSLLHLAHEYRNITESNKKKDLKKHALKKVQAVVRSFVEEENMLVSKNRYFKGAAEFVDTNTVQITYEDGSREPVQFRKKCVIATGSTPARIKISGVPEDKIITSEELFYLPELPESITVIGGGPIGAELATACACFGVKTYLLAREYLSKESREIAHRSLSELQKLGVSYHPVRADRLEDKKFFLENGKTIPETEYYLVATGRNPNVHLQLDKARVVYTEKGIAVNENLQTSNTHIFAIGDCTQNPQFTHLAANHGKFVLKKLLLPSAQRRLRVIPRVTFTSPPIASVGELEETESSKQFVLNFSKLDRAIINLDKQSYGVVLVDLRTGRIKGASLYGDFSEDLINVFTLIIDEQIPLLNLSDFITPYPTYGNIFHSLTVEYINYLSTNWKRQPIRTIYQIVRYMLTWLVLMHIVTL